MSSPSTEYLTVEETSQPNRSVSSSCSTASSAVLLSSSSTAHKRLLVSNQNLFVHIRRQIPIYTEWNKTQNHRGKNTKHNNYNKSGEFQKFVPMYITVFVFFIEDKFTFKIIFFVIFKKANGSMSPLLKYYFFLN